MLTMLIGDITGWRTFAVLENYHASNTTMQEKSTTHKYLVGGMILSMFLWGVSWPSAKVLTRYCSVINFTAYRYVLVVVTMLLIMPMMGMNMRLQRKGIPIVVISGVLLAAYSILFFKGLTYGFAGAGGVLLTTINPIIAYALGVMIQRKVPTRNEAIGLILGLIAGVVLLKAWDNTTAILDPGNLYFFFAAFTWSVLSKFTAIGGRYGTSTSFSYWQYVVTLLCLIPFLDFSELNTTIHITDSLFWFNMIFSSVIVTALATTVFFYTTTRIGSARASSYMFLVPLAAMLSSWAFLGEKILLHTAVGGVLGMIAVYIINRKKAATIVTPIQAPAVKS